MKTIGTIGGRGMRAVAELLAGAALAGVMAAPAWGQAAEAPAAADGAAETVTLAIPAGSLAGALSRFAEASGYQLLYSSALVEGKASAGVSGTVTVAAGLSRLLVGTGLTFRVRSGRTIQIESAMATDGERVTGAVRVEGVEGSPWFGGGGQAAGVNGVNGSRDITATEGTGSFTSGALTIGSKAPQAMKDVPQSVSVLTSERMEQQAVTDYTQALRQLPGVTLEQGNSSVENFFYSRGFEITSIQVDGGAPLTTSANGFFPQLDMAVYDHVELLRGATTSNGFGDPGGTINLVRKKPLDHAQYMIEAQVGSWKNYRLVLDATAPLAFDGKLRGRLITTYQNRHYFYELAKDDRTLVYGVLDLDATPTTLLTAGIQHTRQHSLPWVNGLPRYQNGDDLELPRSTSFALPWNRWDFTTTEIFGAAEQKLGGEWTAKVNLTYNRQRSTSKVGYRTYAVNPTNLLGPILFGDYDDYASKQFSAEAVVNGAFTLFGQRQEVTAGISRASSDFGGLVRYGDLIDGTETSPYIPYPGGPAYYYGSSNGEAPAINVFAFDPYDPLYNEPANTLARSRYPVMKTVQTVAYANLRLTALDRFHLAAGIRWNRYDYKDRYESLCRDLTTSSCTGLQIGDVYSESSYRYAASNISWPPTVTASVDLTRSLKAYIGYTDIYISQANYLAEDNSPLPPVTGSNWEAGLKWAPRNGKLNLSLAAYDIRQKGFATLSGDDYTDLGSGRSCCYIFDPDAVKISRGIDAEVTGEVRPGWQISASYTYNKNRYEGEDYFWSSAGEPLVSLQPKHLYKLWMSYDFGAAGKAGAWSKLSLSGGINGQSSGYETGYVCKVYSGTPDPVTGDQDCEDYDLYSFIVPAYVIVSARIDYRLSKVWSLAVNFDNILDKTYYQTTGGASGGNWYGAPRSALFTLRGKW